VRAHAETVFCNNMYALFMSARLELGCGSGADAPAQDMDCPFMPGTLQFDEAYTAVPRSPRQGHCASRRAHAAEFLGVGLEQGQHEQGQHARAYDERARTTFNPNSNCHCDYLLRATPAEVVRLREFEKWFVVAGNALQRTLRCERAWAPGGAKNTASVTLSKTSLPTRSLAQMRAGAPRFLQHAVCSKHSAAGRTEVVLDAKYALAAPDEISLGRRVRI